MGSLSLKNIRKVLLVFLPIFVLIFLMFQGNTIDLNTDLGKQIKMGEVVVTTHSVPKTNLFSYTNPNFPNIEGEWLSEVVFYLTAKTGGVAALSNLAIVVFSMAFLIPICSLVWQKKNLLAVLLVALLQIGILLQRAYVRPEMFSFLFLVIYVWLLSSYKRKFSYWICALPFLQILWVNSHFFYIVGWGVLGAFVLDALISNAFSLKTKEVRLLVLVFIAVTIANILNPNGLRGALLPFYVFGGYAPVVSENVNILRSQFDKGAQAVTLISDYFFEISLALLFAGLFIRKSRQYAQWFIVAGLGVLGILAVRTVPMLIFAAFAILVDNFSFKPNSKKFYAVAVGAIAVFLLIIFSWQEYRGMYLSSAMFGNSKAVDFIVSNNLTGPIFNNYDTGEYLGYRLYPKERVFIDQRPEAYPRDFMNNYIALQMDNNKFLEAVKKYNFNLVYFTHTDVNLPATTFLKNMVNNPDWALVYVDDWVVIFLRRNDQNKSVIAKYQMTKDKVVVSNIKFSDKNKIAALRLALLFGRVEWWDESATYYKKVLAIDPNECLAIQNLTVIYRQMASPQTDYYWKMFNDKNCQPTT